MEQQIVNNELNKTSMSPRKLISRKTILLGLVCILVITGIVYYMLPEQQAIRAANNYFETSMKGKDNEPYKEGVKVHDFINLLSYKYLNTRNSDKVKDVFDYSYELYNITDKDRFSTYFEAKEWALENIYKDYKVLNNNLNHLEVWKEGNYLRKYTFLYDIEATNGLGEKIYKKVTVEVTQRSVKLDSEKGSYGVSNLIY